MKRKKACSFIVYSVAIFFSIALLIGVGTAHAVVLLQEDFEDYNTDDALTVQSAWVGDAIYVSPYVLNESYLLSQVLSGRGDPRVDGTYRQLSHTLGGALDASLLTTLTFDAYSTSDPLPSHNYVLGFRENGITGNYVWWNSVYDQTGGYPAGREKGWMFSFNFGSGPTNVYVSGGYDEPVSMGIVIDGWNNKIYGTYERKTSDIAGKTAAYDITDEQIASLAPLR